MKWFDRTSIGMIANETKGAIVFAGSPAEAAIGLGHTEVAAMQDLSRRTFESAGLGPYDKVLFAIRREGAPSVELLVQAIASSVDNVAVASPKGRLRLLSTIRALKPNVLVTTPCGAADFLARLYMEFNVDPVELELTKIVLVGEIASPGLRKRLAKEFEAEISEVYCDPVFGAALAARRGGGAWHLAEPGALTLAALEHDEIVGEGLDGQGELLLRPVWAPALGAAAIRTGEVVQGVAGDAGLFNHTVGEHVLARGQWVSLPLLRRQLKLIDGISRWSLTIERGDRTLDSVVLTVGFDRETLVNNPMWKGRIQQAIAAATPIHVDVRTELRTPDDGLLPEAVIDLRGHHLGVSRKSVAR